MVTKCKPSVKDVTARVSALVEGYRTILSLTRTTMRVPGMTNAKYELGTFLAHIEYLELIMSMMVELEVLIKLHKPQINDDLILNALRCALKRILSTIEPVDKPGLYNFLTKEFTGIIDEIEILRPKYMDFYALEKRAWNKKNDTIQLAFKIDINLELCQEFGKKYGFVLELDNLDRKSVDEGKIKFTDDDLNDLVTRFNISKNLFKYYLSQITDLDIDNIKDSELENKYGFLFFGFLDVMQVFHQGKKIEEKIQMLLRENAEHHEKSRGLANEISVQLLQLRQANLSEQDNKLITTEEKELYNIKKELEVSASKNYIGAKQCHDRLKQIALALSKIHNQTVGIELKKSETDFGTVANNILDRDRQNDRAAKLIEHIENMIRGIPKKEMTTDQNLAIKEYQKLLENYRYNENKNIPVDRHEKIKNILDSIIEIDVSVNTKINNEEFKAKKIEDKNTWNYQVAEKRKNKKSNQNKSTLFKEKEDDQYVDTYQIAKIKGLSPKKAELILGILKKEIKQISYETAKILITSLDGYVDDRGGGSHETFGLPQLVYYKSQVVSQIIDENAYNDDVTKYKKDTIINPHVTNKVIDNNLNSLRMLFIQAGYTEENMLKYLEEKKTSSDSEFRPI